MQSHKCQVEGNNHLPWPSGHAFADTVQYTGGLHCSRIPCWITSNWMFVVGDTAGKNMFWKKDVDLYREMEEMSHWGNRRSSVTYQSFALGSDSVSGYKYLHRENTQKNKYSCLTDQRKAQPPDDSSYLDKLNLERKLSS